MHDPRRHIGQLQQALSRDRLALGVLLGAGCPTSINVEQDGNTQPLIPAISELTKRVREACLASDKHKAVFQTVVKRLDAKKEANVEQLLTRVRALQEIAAEGEIDGVSGEALAALDDFIAETISANVGKDLPPSSNGYHDLARWIGGIPRACAVELFTTNYDLLIEQALESRQIPFFDGFVGAERPFFDLVSIEQDSTKSGLFPARWARLWKVHGSINWWLIENGPGKTVVRARNVSGGKQRLIHPSHLKYDDSRRMPYLAMLDRLRAFLARSPCALVICGYSFSDEHINELIVHGLEANANSVCFALLRSELAKYKTAVSLSERRPNLNLLTKDGAVAGGKAGKWNFAADMDEQSLTGACTLKKSAGGAIEGGTFDLGHFEKFGAFLAQLAARHSANTVDS